MTDTGGPDGFRTQSRTARHKRPRVDRVVAPVPRAAAHRRRRAGCCIAAVIVLVLAVVAGGAVWWTLYRAESDVPAGRTMQVQVPKGASSAEVGRLLAAKGVVANSTMFVLRARSLDASSRLKPGVYDLKTGSGYDGVIRALQAGPTIVYYSVAIPEGWTIDGIAARVEEKTGVTASEFSRLAGSGSKEFGFPFLAGNPTHSLEGYLFPKTYQVRKGTSARDIIRMMLTQYGKEISSVDYSYARSRGLTEHDVLTIASIIEREASVAKDRPLVASVIYNRLKKKMRLQLDSTVMYVIGNREKLFLNDLKVESPYNTYLHAGLPPGPIANPGLASLRAAAQPAESGYLYYIMDHKDGSQSFAVTYEDFLRLKTRARKGLQ